MDEQESSMCPTPAADTPDLPQRARLDRRGLTIGHWLLIVIFVALCVDIGIRIVAFRRAQQSIAQYAAAERATRQFLETMRTNNAVMDAASAKSKKSMETFRELMKEMQKKREPSDSEQVNIIPL